MCGIKKKFIKNYMYACCLAISSQVILLDVLASNPLEKGEPSSSRGNISRKRMYERALEEGNLVGPKNKAFHFSDDNINADLMAPQKGEDGSKGLIRPKGKLQKLNELAREHYEKSHALAERAKEEERKVSAVGETLVEGVEIVVEDRISRASVSQKLKDFCLERVVDPIAQKMRKLFRE